MVEGPRPCDLLHDEGVRSQSSKKLGRNLGAQFNVAHVLATALRCCSAHRNRWSRRPIDGEVSSLGCGALFLCAVAARPGWRLRTKTAGLFRDRPPSARKEVRGRALSKRPSSAPPGASGCSGSSRPHRTGAGAPASASADPASRGSRCRRSRRSRRTCRTSCRTRS